MHSVKLTVLLVNIIRRSISMPSTKNNKSRTVACPSILKGFMKQTTPPHSSISTTQLLTVEVNMLDMVRLGIKLATKSGAELPMTSNVQPAICSFRCSFSERIFSTGVKLQTNLFRKL